MCCKSIQSELKYYTKIGGTDYENYGYYRQPSKKGNSFAMTEAFIEEAKKCGHTIQRFDAASMNVKGCHACMTCYKTGKACSFNEEFDVIASSILESDAIVLLLRFIGILFLRK